MVSLELHRPHWIKGDGDDPSDQCAHGFVELSIDGVRFASTSDGDLTVSAAALFLLRTVTSDHAPNQSVTDGNFLIPCCGFTIWPSETTRYPYYIVGCNHGINPEIRHREGAVHIVLGEKSAAVPLHEWVRAVLRFSDQVQDFYDSSAPKDTIEDDLDRAGWDLFWQEWRGQRNAARRVVGA